MGNMLKNLKIFSSLKRKYFNPDCMVCILSPINYISYFLLPMRGNCPDCNPGTSIVNFELETKWVIGDCLILVLYLIIESGNIFTTNLYCNDPEKANMTDCLLMINETLFTFNGIILLSFCLLKRKVLLKFYNGWKDLFAYYTEFQLHPDHIEYFVNECSYLFYLQNVSIIFETIFFIFILTDNLEYMIIRHICLLLTLYSQWNVTFQLSQTGVFYFIVNCSFEEKLKRSLIGVLSEEDRKRYFKELTSYHSIPKLENEEENLKLYLRYFLAAQYNVLVFNEFYNPEMLIRFLVTNSALILNLYLVLIGINSLKLFIMSVSTTALLSLFVQAYERVNKMVSLMCM